MFGWFSEARVWASRVNRASRSASLANESGRTLSATSRLQLRIAGPIHLPHAPFTNVGDDFVDTEARAGGESQSFRGLYGRGGCHGFFTPLSPGATGFRRQSTDVRYLSTGLR